MSHEYFVIRQRRLSVFGWALCTLLFSAIVAVLAMNWLIHTFEGVYGDLIYIALFILFSLLLVASIVFLMNVVVWKCTVQGECICYRSLRFRNEFTFDDISRIEFEAFQPLYSVETKTYRIFLHGRKRPLLLPVKAVGMNILIERLKSKKIMGSKSL